MLTTLHGIFSSRVRTFSPGVFTQRTSSFTSPDEIFAVEYLNNQFLANGSSGKLATSSDGTTWLQRTSSFGTTIIYDSAFGLGLYVLVGGTGKLATSANATSWTQRTSSFITTSIFNVIFDGQKFIAVGASGKIATSSDGTTWAQVTDSSFGATFIYSVAYSSALTTYVAVGSSGKIAVSTDGSVPLI